MQTYYDTGVLVKLYVPEQFSEAAIAYVANRHRPVAFNLLHELEIENALRLKIHRREIDDSECEIILNKIAGHVVSGHLQRQAINWPGAVMEAKKLSALATRRHGCRTLDLIHVGIAVIWGCSDFVSMDDRQIQAARMLRLNVIDIRK